MSVGTGPPAPYDAPPPRRSGCLVALYVLFGVGLFVLVAGGIAVYVFLQTEDGQKIWDTAKRSAEWAVAASQAPGTAELRDAGCEQAMVSDAGAALDIFMTWIPEPEKQAAIRQQLEAEAGQGDIDQLRIVICTLPRFTTGQPACDDLARTYGQTVDDAPESFYVMVIQQGQESPACQGIYSPDGRLLHEPDLSQ